MIIINVTNIKLLIELFCFFLRFVFDCRERRKRVGKNKRKKKERGHRQWLRVREEDKKGEVGRERERKRERNRESRIKKGGKGREGER